ncbi:MAG: hypothetical protein ACSLEL_00660 [Candidatus Malihini olakiniferum]
MCQYLKHPTCRQIFDLYRKIIFRSDICNADVKLGDLLIHKEAAKKAQKFTTKILHSDKTYFLVNRTSPTNKVMTNALLTPGD